MLNAPHFNHTLIVSQLRFAFSINTSHNHFAPPIKHQYHNSTYLNTTIRHCARTRRSRAHLLGGGDPVDDIYKLATWIYLKLVRFLPTADGLHGLAHHVNPKLLSRDGKIGMIGHPLILEALRSINTYNSWCNQKETLLLSDVLRNSQSYLYCCLFSVL